MKTTELLQAAERLEERIVGASMTARQALQPEFNEVLSQLRASGIEVPSRLTKLDRELGEEAIEAYFESYTA
ncbi:hypothetical protein FEE96_16255 [Parasedimentitalea maritima]|uniref:Uncharacterized protein n=1 Tax=Parasedimentitalea maritima TaxID=2578117 RepID=A0A5R8Z3Z7_9RHOB|nr:hypothetical protein [Zongyanglinia marina]KAE9631495.1 hypothetical protein GP644_04025 [Zongyanglinia marina]TLP60410.1 hypothetical protein FEE96_16255 [Zongyanglinia marina]